ncbi:MAG: hypothetical protein FWD53_07865, partial [Phycisphaerales bacterium]|nr:hypothetical protein [Phycisphaerales bacterium]
MIVASFSTYFAELFFIAILIIAIRTLLARWLGPNVKRMLWVLLIFKALVPLTLPTAYHPLGVLSPTVEIDAPNRAAIVRLQGGVGGGGAPHGNAVVDSPIGTQPPHYHAVLPTPSAAISDDSALFSAAIVMHTKMILLSVWTLGAVMLLTLAIYRNRTVIKHATQHPVPVPDWVQTIFLECREKLRLNTWPVLIVSPYIPSPCLVGALRPRILIPESLLAHPHRDEQRIRHLLLHELVHLKQGDLWLAWLWTLTLSIHWFNPLFWLLGRWLKFDCETACDSRVLTILAPQDRPAYGNSLLHMLLDKNINITPRIIPGSLGVIETRCNLERRLTMMQNHRMPSLLHRLTACTIFLLLALLCLTSYAQQQPSLSAEKAKVMGYVENYFANNFRDITMRKSLSWSDPTTDAKGNVSITYKYEAMIWDKDKKVIEQRFTFDKTGKYIGHETIETNPADATPPAPADKPATPRILKMFPANRANDVDPNTPFLMLQFNQKMGDGISWCQFDPKTFPKSDDKFTGERWLNENTISLLPVQLEPNKTYTIGINTPPFIGFYGEASNQPLPALTYTFKTSNKPLDPQRRQTLADEMKRAIQEAPTAPPPAAAAPMIIKMLPANANNNVDPNTPFLILQFNQKMDGG